MGIPSALASQTPASGDQANSVVTGALGAQGAGGIGMFRGLVNVAIWGTFTGTAKLERSFDGGTTWIAYQITPGTDVALTAAGSFVVNEPEAGVCYRVNCSAYTNGTINYRISTTGGGAQSLSYRT